MKIHQHFDLIAPSSAANENLPPLVFLHAMCFNRKTWKKVAPDIAVKTGRKAFLIDARNHGESSWSDRMDYDILSQDLLDFLNEHYIHKAVIIGHSMGGRTAINFALKYPQRVDMIIVEDMTPRNVSSAKASSVTLLLDAMVNTLKSIPTDMDLDSAVTHIVKYLTSAMVENVDEETMNKYYDLEMVPLKKGKNSIEATTNLDAVRAMLDGNHLVQNLPEKNIHFDGDALFVHASSGFFNLGNDPSVKKMFPKALIKKIDGACHYIHLSKPDEYKDIVSNFILERNCTTASKY